MHFCILAGLSMFCGRAEPLLPIHIMHFHTKGMTKQQNKGIIAGWVISDYK